MMFALGVSKRRNMLFKDDGGLDAARAGDGGPAPLVCESEMFRYVRDGVLAIASKSGPRIKLKFHYAASSVPAR